MTLEDHMIMIIEDSARIAIFVFIPRSESKLSERFTPICVRYSPRTSVPNSCYGVMTKQKTFSDQAIVIPVNVTL